MNNLNRFQIDHVFSSPYLLPHYLNLFGVSAQQLNTLHIAHAPQLVRALCMSLLRRSGKDAYVRARLHRLHPTNEEARTQCLVIIRKADIKENLLLQKARDLVRDNLLYDRDGKVYSEIVGGFSYGDTDYEVELEPYRAVECPECGQTETVLADNPEDALETAEKFTHLSGPYCRCERCDKAVRPTVEAATCLPDSHFGYDNDDHDLYVEQLDYLLEQMTGHLDALGLPAPSRLHIGVSNADWRGRDAHAKSRFDGKELAEKLSVRGDYMVRGGKLRVESNGHVSMTCVLAHHDASSPITIVPEWECEMDENVELFQEDLDEAKVLARVADRLLAGQGETFEYDDRGETFTLVSNSSLAEGIRELTRRLGYDTKPESFNDLMEIGSDTPELDLIAYNLFQIEDFASIKKAPANVIEVQAVFVRRALDAFLNKD